MPGTSLNILILLVAIAGGLYQFYFKEVFLILGHNRVIESIGNKDCKQIPELRACEKIVLHQPTGHVYIACSEPERRVQWLPATLQLNSTGSSRDYVAVYDPETSRITKLKMPGFDDPRGYSAHGMDIVPSASNPSELFVYLVNHRPPVGQDAAAVGADSVLEIFKTTVGDDKLIHVKTFESPLIITPNDVVGSDDGQSFFVTNDHGQKVGTITRTLDGPLGRKKTSVVYCHVKEGCKYAIQKMHGNNGIARASNGTFYVANAQLGGMTILELQLDNTLVITDHIKTDRGLDNLAVDANGHVWAAGAPKVLTLVGEHFKNPKILSPSSALRFSVNTGPNAFYGEKYKVDKVFEDDGNVASGTTSAVYDARRKRLFLHGICAPHLTICKLK